MWLMHVETRQLEEFYNNIPPYAILSHTWGLEEVCFQDLNTEGHKGKHGYAKIDGCCRQAQKHGLSYVWVDTCCIDKSSSAELSEAINSIYRWYEMAKCCYVYLEDVTPGEDPYDPSSTFRRSRWLERGWTLQELIAPSRLDFFDANWNRLFIISSHAHAGASEPVELLSTLTAITARVLLNEVSLASISVACKFSWAAKRRTTRSEDMAYCLMGLLQVNMPLLYGEGDQAFVRLQEVVLGKSDDITALSWGYQLSLSPFLDPRAFAKVGTVLARTPGAFINYPRSNTRNIGHAPNTHTMTTGNGLQVDIPMICVDRTRAIWFDLVIEDLSRTYRRDPEAMHGIAIVLEENANRFQRSIGCPPVRIRYFGQPRGIALDLLSRLLFFTPGHFMLNLERSSSDSEGHEAKVGEREC